MTIRKIESKLIKLCEIICSYDNGRLRNLSVHDSEGYNILKEHFFEYEHTVNKYISLISHNKINHVPLPPFIVFPTYSSVTLGWRMGAGEEYEEFWMKKIQNLSQEELIEYCKKFDYPEWWIKDFPFKETTLKPRYYKLPWKNL